MNWTQIMWSIGLALIGALLSYWVQVLINNWWYKKKTKLVGMWRSKYRLPYGLHEWVEEDINVTTSRGKICFTSHDNPAKDHYVAYAKLVTNEHLIGRWESTRPHATAQGAFVLARNPLGETMYGYFVGPDDTGRSFYGTWVLTKKDNEKDEPAQLAYGYRLLEESSQSFSLQNYLKS